jgi:DNA-binding NtrC family response regulator
METKKILIIDDDPNIRKTLSDILKVKGYTTFSAQNGRDGMEFTKHTPVNLAIIDLGLPDISGLEVLDLLKADDPFIEAIILTGNASLDSAIEATNKGAFSYLLKPYDIEQLMVHVKRSLEKQEARETIARHNEELQKINDRLTASNEELKNEIREREKAEMEKEKLIIELKESLSKIKTLTGLLPICAWCKKIRDDAGYWQQLESYIGKHSSAEFSHSICPECLEKHFGDDIE